MYSTTDFRKGLKIELDGEPFVITDCQHVKPGKGVAFVKTKYKSLVSGRVLNKNFRSGDKVDRPDLEERDMQYLYQDGEDYVFMDQQSYDQITIMADSMTHAMPYLKDNLEVAVLFHNGKALSIDLPNFVIMEVTYTEPGFKGDTATGVTKAATAETDAEFQVPLYINVGDKIKIDTRKGSFVERVKS
jgi:elongation factor P